MRNFVLCGICLLAFSHDAVQILASPESITGGAPNCKIEESCYYFTTKHNFIQE